MNGNNERVGSEIDSNTNIQDFNIDGETEKQSHVPFSMKISAIMSKFSRLLVLELLIFCYMVASTLPHKASHQLYKYKLCRTDRLFRSRAEACALVLNGTVNLYFQMDVYIKTLQMKPIISSISVIITLFLGAWSDRTGNRKALLILPVIGNMIATWGFLFAIYFLDWSVWYIILMHRLPSAMVGGHGVMIMGTVSYIADVIQPDLRMMRIGILNVVAVLTYTIARYVSGPLFNVIGSLGVFAVVMTFHSIAIILALVRVKGATRTNKECALYCKVFQFFHPRNVWKTIAIGIKPRGRQQASILLLIFGYILLLGPEKGGEVVPEIYLKKVTRIDPTDIELDKSLTAITSSLGTTIAVTIFSKTLHLGDTVLGIIGVTSKVAAGIYYGVVRHKLWYYFGVLLDIFEGLPALAIRSLATKVVEPEKVAKMCSIIGIVEFTVPHVYKPIMTSIYRKTKKSFPGAYMIANGIFVAPDFIIFIAIYFLMKKRENCSFKNPAAEETNSKENYIAIYT